MKEESSSTAVVGFRSPEEMNQYLAHLASPEGFKQQQQLSSAYDKACLALIGENDVQVDGNRTFKKKSAWRKLQRAFNISTQVMSEDSRIIEGVYGESVFISRITVRALAPWGQFAEAVGACATDEATGMRVITIADAIATAETRATNRAVSSLIAMGEVSAEEIGDRSADTRGAGSSRPTKDPGETKMPFGKTKGTKLKDLPRKDVEGAMEWAEEKSKFPDFVEIAKAFLNPPKQAETAAAGSEEKGIKVRQRGVVPQGDQAGIPFNATGDAGEYLITEDFLKRIEGWATDKARNVKQQIETLTEKGGQPTVEQLADEDYFEQMVADVLTSLDVRAVPKAV